VPAAAVQEQSRGDLGEVVGGDEAQQPAGMDDGQGNGIPA